MFPNIPKEYYKDFIRGYFDGDGSVYIDNSYIQVPRLGVCIVGGFDFCSSLKNILSEEFKDDIGYIYEEKYYNDEYIRQQGLLYRFCIFKQEHIKLFYEYIYYDNCVKLERKYNVFFDFYNKI